MKILYTFLNLKQNLLQVLIFIFCLFVQITLLNSQTLVVTHFDADGSGEAEAMQDCGPPIGVVTDFKDHLTVPWVQGGTTWFGVPYDYISALSYPVRVNSCGTVRGNISAHCYVGGDGTGTVLIDWYNWASVYALLEPVYHAHAWSTYWYETTVQVMPGGGYNVGDTIELYYQYHFSGAGITEHENVIEDPVSTINTCDLNGNSIIGNLYDFANPPGLTGWRRETTDGTMMVVVGDTLRFDFHSVNKAEINPPGLWLMGGQYDYAQSKFRGKITLSLDSIPLPPQFQPGYSPKIEFSLDIGSDAELSDPNQNSNEVFDPGDAYLLKGAFISTPQNGIKDDAMIYGYDPSPVPGDLTSNVPCGSGVFDPLPYFNLNGMDNMQASLSGMTYGPGFPSIQYYDDSLVFMARHLLISYDDDGPENWSYNSFGFQSVPVNSQSPMSIDTFGKTSKADEVIAADFDPYQVPSFPFSIDSLWSEADVHPNLAPNPDLGEEPDNDVNALNYFPNQNIDGIFYFTPNSEATHVNPATLLPLNPGSVYQVISPGNFVEVVNPVTHLGLLDGTDINAFSFGWVYDSIQGRLGLALLFSVDMDDWTTVQDESGGLDPSMIYFSFLDGSHKEFSGTTLKDNIDAITIVPHSFNGYALPPLSCDPPTSLNVTTTPTDAALMWTEPLPPPANGYEIELYDDNGVQVWNDAVPAGTSNYAFAGLAPNTTYSAVVRSDCGGGQYAEEWITFVTPLFSDISIDNETFTSSYDDCIEAASTITMSNSTVESGADLVLVAGQSIVILPETHIEQGSRFLAAIDNGGNYCSAYKHVVNAEDQEAISEPAVSDTENQEAMFRVYPNPTDGAFTLEFLHPGASADISVEVFGMMGERILHNESAAGLLHRFDLSGNQPGMYIVRVVSGDEIGVEKLILR